MHFMDDYTLYKPGSYNSFYLVNTIIQFGLFTNRTSHLTGILIPANFCANSGGYVYKSSFVGLLSW